MNEKTSMIASKLKEAVSFEKLNIEALKPNNKEKFSSLLINDEFRKAKTFREQVKIALIMLRPEDERFKVTFEEFTHTQCVLHIIRLRLIIFHTPKIFSRRNKIE